jgi:hypothetical protein
MKDKIWIAVLFALIVLLGVREVSRGCAKPITITPGFSWNPAGVVKEVLKGYPKAEPGKPVIRWYEKRVDHYDTTKTTDTLKVPVPVFIRHYGVRELSANDGMVIGMAERFGQAKAFAARVQGEKWKLQTDTNGIVITSPMLSSLRFGVYAQANADIYLPSADTVVGGAEVGLQMRWKRRVTWSVGVGSKHNFTPYAAVRVRWDWLW